MTARQRQRVSTPWNSGQTAVLSWTPDPSETTWQEYALCAETDPEVFFPARGEPATSAKKVCMACEVRTECLEYALEHGERYGIWGGLSEQQRRKLHRQQEAA